MSNIIFNKLMSIDLMHEFYANGICNDLIITPSPSSQTILRNYGILFKSATKGAVLLYESPDESGTAKLPIDKKLKLTFFFNSCNSFFTNFTQLDFSNEPGSLYYFNNLSPAISGQNHTIVDSGLTAPIPLITKDLKVIKKSGLVKYILLTDLAGLNTKLLFPPEQDDFVIKLSETGAGPYTIKQYDNTDSQVGTSFHFYYNNELKGQIPFAVFELHIDKTYDVSNPINLVFKFKSRETFWRYKILKNKAGTPLSTDDFTSTTLSVDHEPDNPADKIDFQNPSGTNPIIIKSVGKIKLRETGYDKIRLYKNSNILNSNLPNPSAKKIEHEGTDWYSDIYVYVYV